MKKLLTVLALAGFAMACGDDDKDPEGNVTPDSGVDAGRDAGPGAGDAGPRVVKVTNAGNACAADTECTGGAAKCDKATVLGQPLTGGYCSAQCLYADECGSTGDCPLGEIIRAVGSAAAMGQTAGSCYKKCTANTSGDCRDGYVCSSLSAALGIPANPVLPALGRTVCLPPTAPVDGGVPSKADGGVDGGTLDAGT
jgi:hypothetical protein